VGDHVLTGSKRDTRPPDTIVAATNISKSFAGRTVLRSLDLDILPGEVHGLVGQNGSGKSTFIKILAGYHAPDPGGQLSVCGREVALPLLPGQPRGLGISFVHQDLGLAGSMTVLDNLRVGRYESRLGWRIPWSRERQRVRQKLAEFGLPCGPDTLVSALSEVEVAMVAIIRALEQLESTERGLLVLDEPTAYLPRDGVDRLFDGVRQVAAMGLGVLFVSHRLDEIRALTDRVTVLRDGDRVLTAATADLSENALIEHILGRRPGSLYPSGEVQRRSQCLQVRNLTAESVEDVSFDVGAGEIIGLTGLLGMGFEQVPYLLFGAQHAHSGTIAVNGAVQELPSLTPPKAIASGLALVPANRQRYGGVASATVTENVTLPTIGGFFRRGFLNHRREHEAAASILDDYDVRPREPRRPFGTLSGGNQQKVLLAKWFGTQPTVLLLHEPTQGVDVGARIQIFQRIHRAAQDGKAVLIASSEYADLANLCHRVHVFRDRRIVAELYGSNLTEDRIVECAFRDQTRTTVGEQPS
jgi:ribose transport system ATP-binding protein